MRDLIRNYRMVLKGHNRDSETEEESQPLVSSSNSSAANFGTAKHVDSFRSDFSYSETEDENESRRSFGSTFKQASNPLTRSTSPIRTAPPSAISKNPERYSTRTLLPPSYDFPGLDFYATTENVYEHSEDYAKINGNFGPDALTWALQHGGFKKESFECLALDYSGEVPGTQSSLVTIFAIWNTTMGSSLLAMAWGLERSGFFVGIGLNIVLAALCLFTCYVLLSVNEKHGLPGQSIEVPDLCRMLIGKWAEILAKVFSMIVLIGASMVYWILLSNCLYNSVYLLYGVFATQPADPLKNLTVICPKELNLNVNDSTQLTMLSNFTTPVPTTFDRVWDLYSTVPVILGVIMFPILNFKSATFFTKFNSLGTISVMYLLSYVAIKAASWGINIQDWSAELEVKPTFAALSGMLSLSYFIHNIIISIMRNNRHPQHNGRDLSIAFGLVTFTYLFIGVVFYMCFPLAKSCIEDNILNNFNRRDILTIIARILLMFQLFTVFPLITFMLRNDILGNINCVFKNYTFGNFTYGRVIALNFGLVVIYILIACFLPRIGTLIRYTGAMSGLVYIFMLPSLLKIASLRKEGNLTVTKLVFYVLVIIVGAVNLLSQFFISDTK